LKLTSKSVINAHPKMSITTSKKNSPIGNILSKTPNKNKREKRKKIILNKKKFKKDIYKP
jgi:hypothetical protein